MQVLRLAISSPHRLHVLDGRQVLHFCPDFFARTSQRLPDVGEPCILVIVSPFGKVYTCCYDEAMTTPMRQAGVYRQCVLPVIINSVPYTTWHTTSAA